jgi:hypothetical protein
MTKSAFNYFPSTFNGFGNVNVWNEYWIIEIERKIIYWIQFGWRLGSVAGFCEHGNECFAFTEGMKYYGV